MSANGGGRGGRRRSRTRGGGGGEGGGRGGGGQGGGRDSGDPIIAEVMSENDIDPQDIPNAKKCEPDNLGSIRGSKRYFLVRGFAWYRQHKSRTGCTRKWASAYSWCVIDLKQQRIIHKYGQDCKTCGGKSTPSFNEEARTRMAEYVCRKYLYRVGRLQRPEHSQPDMTDLSGEREGPHDQSRCDMCKVLGRSCQSKATETKPLSGTQSDDQSLFYHYSSSSASSQSSPTVLWASDTQAPPEPWCTTCGSSDHSYWDCTYQRYKEESDYSSSTSDDTDHYSTTSQLQWTPKSYHTVSRPPTSSPVPRSGTRGSVPVSSTDQMQTDPTSLHPMLHCTFCGSTDHTYWSCTSRTREQERTSSTRRVRTATVSRSNTRPRNDNHGEGIGLLGLAAVGAVALGLGALLLGRR